MKIKYHQQTFDVLEIVPKFSPERLERVSSFEAQYGLRLPAAMREWYSLDGCNELLERMTIIGHSAIDLAEAPKYQTAYFPEFSVREPLPVLFENQGVWHIAVDLLEGDDPRVYLRYNEDGASWKLHAHSFSDWIYALAWDYSILVQNSGQYFFVDTDEQWNQYSLGNDRLGPETLVGNAVFWGERFRRVMRQGKRLLIVAPERDPDEDSVRVFDVVSDADFHRQLPVGQESDWIGFAEMIVQHGKIAVSDPAFYNDLPPPPTFDLVSGTYSVAVKIMDYPQDKRVSRLRVFGNAPAAIGARIGEVGVDFAQVGVFDPILLTQVSDHLSEEQAKAMAEELQTVGLAGVAHFGESGATMPVVCSGFGDGSYPIYELIHDGRRIGIEVVFIGAEALAESDSSTQGH